MSNQAAPEDRLLREVFAMCEATEDAPQPEPKNEHQAGFERGRRFEAKQIRKAIGTWFQDTFCGASHMGEPVISPAPITRAAADVLAERQRQIGVEGWTPEHDDEHSDGSMARAAASYALMAASRETSHPSIAKALSEMAAKAWPWDAEWFKPSTSSRDLVKAGALLLAERERLDRADTASRHAAAAPWIA